MCKAGKDIASPDSVMTDVIPSEKDWLEPCPNYRPPDVTSTEVIAHPSSDIENVANIQGFRDREYWWMGGPRSARDCVDFDPHSERPLHPCGRQGKCGRGVLFLWGENRKVVEILVREAYDNWQVLARKGYDGTWNLPETALMPSEAVMLERALTQMGADPELAAMLARHSDFAFSAIANHRHTSTDNAWESNVVYFGIASSRKIAQAATSLGEWRDICSLPETFPHIGYIRRKTRRATERHRSAHWGWYLTAGLATSAAIMLLYSKS